MKGFQPMHSPLSQKSHLLWQAYSLCPINPNLSPSKDVLLILPELSGMFVV